MINNKMLGYKDIVINPIVSNMVSTELVDISFRLPDETKSLSLPLLTRVGGSNSIDICSALSDLGILGIIDKIDNIHEKYSANSELLSGLGLWGISVNIEDNPKETIKVLELNPTIVDIRSGSGYSLETLKFTEEIKEYCVHQGLNSLVSSGNVITLDGTNALLSAGADLVRVGNPGGAYFYEELVHIPQVTAIQDCWNADVMIIADEDQLSLGDFIKALVIGADLCMVQRIVPDDYDNYRVHLRMLVDAYISDVRMFCMSMNANTIDAMRNNSEIIVK